jgi:cytochrome P450
VPTTRENPFDPPAALAAAPPISRLRYPDGSLGWLVTDHAAARFVLSDPRFSSRLDLAKSPIRDTPPVTVPGAFLFMDPPDHTRYRRLLTGQFTLRRMRELEPRITEIATERAAALVAAGPGSDLVHLFALPLASLVICELLGVPYTHHERFERATHAMVDPALPEPARDAAGGEVFALLATLVADKRAAPANDLLSGLLSLTDEEIIGIGVMLLFAGHETTANMLALGAFALLSQPAQLERLRADPALTEGAVEELLRHLSIVQYEVNRAALDDVAVAGQQVAKGESLLVSIPMANRDPARFPHPSTMDITRTTAGHMAFGHGVHQCLGQQLARTELKAGFTALLAAIPTLTLAVAPETVPLRTGRGIYGVDALPVTWDVSGPE